MCNSQLLNWDMDYRICTNVLSVVQLAALRIAGGFAFRNVEESAAGTPDPRTCGRTPASPDPSPDRSTDPRPVASSDARPDASTCPSTEGSPDRSSDGSADRSTEASPEMRPNRRPDTSTSRSPEGRTEGSALDTTCDTTELATDQQLGAKNGLTRISSLDIITNG
jgi:hypothetical protein